MSARTRPPTDLLQVQRLTNGFSLSQGDSRDAMAITPGRVVTVEDLLAAVRAWAEGQ